MDIEKLKHYQELKRDIDSMENLKNSMYFNVHSPSSNESHSTTPGNPTEESVKKIFHYDQMIDQKMQELRETMEEIIEWCDKIEDHDVRAIINWHFLMGLTWKETARKMYSYYNSEACKQKFYRYVNHKPWD